MRTSPPDTSPSNASSLGMYYRPLDHKSYIRFRVNKFRHTDTTFGYSPSCRISGKLLSIPTLDITPRWLAGGLCILTLPLRWTYWRILWLQCSMRIPQCHILHLNLQRLSQSTDIPSYSVLVSLPSLLKNLVETKCDSICISPYNVVVGISWWPVLDESPVPTAAYTSTEMYLTSI